jgi:hypothetical protein
MADLNGFEGPERSAASNIARYIANVALCRTMTGNSRYWCLTVAIATILLGVIPWVDTNLLGALQLPNS